MGYDPSSAKSISPLQTSRSTHHLSPPREGRDMPSFMGLLKAVMSVCAADGKVLRIQQLTRDAGMTEESFMMALQRICDILGCYRLELHMPQDVIMQAVGIYLEGYGNMENNLVPNSQLNGSLAQNMQHNLGMQNSQNSSISQREREYRLQLLRTENEMYSRGNSLGSSQALQNGGGQWGSQNGVNRSMGMGQRSSFNYDSYDGNGSNPHSQRGGFPGQNGNMINQRQFSQDQYYGNPIQNRAGSGAGGSYGISGSRVPGGAFLSSHDMDDDMMLNENNMHGLNLNMAGGGGGGGRGGGLPGLSPGGTSFGVNAHSNGNLSSRISRASFPAPANANYSLQQDMARLQQQQLDFPTQPIGVGRGGSSGGNIGLPRGMTSPRLSVTSGSEGMGSERSVGLDRGSERSRDELSAREVPSPTALTSGLNSQSVPFYPTSTPISANMSVIKSNVDAAGE